MYYIELENEELVKYEVILNKVELKKIKNKVIYNCGMITHHCYVSDYGPEYKSQSSSWIWSHIRKYSADFVGYREYFEETREKYRYEYDEYSDTRLVTLIDQLLNGDMSVISELKNPKEETGPKPSNENELQKKLEKLLSLTPKEISTWELEKIKKEIEEYQIQEKLNSDRKSDLEYYPLVLSCIEMREVARIENKFIQISGLLTQMDIILEEMKTFFQETDEKNICINEYQKIMKRIYKEEAK